MIKGFTSIALISGGGLDYTEISEVSKQGQIFQSERSVKSTMVPHPDLVGRFKSMKRFLLRSIGLDFIPGLMSLADDKEVTAKRRNAVAALQDDLAEIGERLHENLEVTKVSISGTEDKPKVVLSGKMRTPTGNSVALNSPLIALGGTKLGFEADLFDIIDELCLEVEEFKDGKAAQLSMEFGDEQEDGDTVEEEQTEKATA